jgi:hypothetical protein
MATKTEKKIEPFEIDLEFLRAKLENDRIKRRQIRNALNWDYSKLTKALTGERAILFGEGLTIAFIIGVDPFNLIKD